MIAPNINQSAQYSLDASASSNSYDEFYSLSGNNSITVLSLISLINGTVLDSINKTAISGAVVSTNTSVSTITDASGFYSLAVSAGTFNITAKLEPTYHTNCSVTVTTELNTVVVKYAFNLN